MKLCLIGYGKMGKAVEVEAKARGHEIVGIVDERIDDLIEYLQDCQPDAVIEFTHPSEAWHNFEKVVKAGIPLVTGTTGWNDKMGKVAALVRLHQGVMVYSSNFSPGVNILFRLNEILAKLMNGQPGYDVYLEEAHHKYKKDAPSGTAITLLNALTANIQDKDKWVYGGLSNQAPEPNEISVAVTRAGDIPGKHAVVYRSEIDEIRISHEAYNRRGFALGAVLAAEWAIGKQGFHNFARIFE